MIEHVFLGRLRDDVVQGHKHEGATASVRLPHNVDIFYHQSYACERI